MPWIDQSAFARLAMRLPTVVSAFALAALLGAAPTTVHAQTGATGEAGQDPVFVFNRICYGQVPSVAAIRDMALELAWRRMEDEALKQFAPDGVAPDVLEGWDAQVGDRIYRVAISQSKPSPSLAEGALGFENGTATTCTMVLDENHDPAVFLPNMQTLARKDPVSADVEGPEGVRTTTWAGGNDDVKIVLVARANPDADGGVLAVTILQK